MERERDVVLGHSKFDMRFENEHADDGDCEGVVTVVAGDANTLANTVAVLVTAFTKHVALEDVGDSFVGFSGISEL